MCHFSDFTDDGLYQICSCNKHAWSCRAQKCITASNGGYFYVSSQDGTRYKLYVVNNNTKKSEVIMRILLTIGTMTLFYYYYFTWLHAPPIPTI